MRGIKMPVTDWSKIWKHEVLIDGKLMSPEEYQRQRRIAALSDDAKAVLVWLEKRRDKRSVVTLVEMAKTVTPISLRKSCNIRAAMVELVKASIAKPALVPVKYSGLMRKEAWLLIHLNHP